MMKFAAFFFSCLSVYASAQEASLSSTTGFFIGLGESYNSVKVDAHLKIRGVSNVISQGIVLASGEVKGETIPYHQTEQTFAPGAQIGYSGYFKDTPWFLGGKFVYNYLGLTFTDRTIDFSQGSLFTPIAPVLDDFIGKVVIKSAQTSVNHELAFLVFFGHAFKKTRLYLGAGPVVFQATSHLYQMLGFVNVDGTPSDVFGDPVNFSSSKWMWGGIGQLGLTYDLNSSWFLDVNYVYGATGKYKKHKSSPFESHIISSANQNITQYTDLGTLFTAQSQRVTIQSLSITVNKAF